MSSADLDQRHDVESSVHSRYAAAAHERQDELCCPISYNAGYLEIIPQEIIDRDYGCGDPTPFVEPGNTVVDLGSGGGKACYILAQIVGKDGRVIGVDCNAEMLALARQYRQAVAQKLGYANVEFRCGLIQDLALDLDALAEELGRRPITNQSDWLRLRATEDRLRGDSPMIPNESVDCVVSNCVLNLVKTQDRQQLFAEVFRVLRQGGRVAISDIVADKDVPDHLRRDPKLWSGCLSGAYREDRFLKAFEDAGFQNTQVAKRQVEPWRVVEGIEFRSITVVAFKSKQQESQELVMLNDAQAACCEPDGGCC